VTHQQPRKNDNAASGGFSRGPKSSEMFAAKGVKEDGDEQAANSLYLPRRYLDT